MKQFFFILFIGLLSSAQLKAQRHPKIEDVDISIQIQFYDDWSLFRLLKNPLIPDEVKFPYGGFPKPTKVLFPQSMFRKGYRPEVKISNWGEAKGGNKEFIDLSNRGFYLVEKKDGCDMVKMNFMRDSILDRVHLNIYDSIFPYDNRYLIKYAYTNPNTYNKIFSFQSGNAEWGKWNDAQLMKRVDVIGFVRGVQFGVENVIFFRPDFSDKIRAFRPDFLNYVYTSNRGKTLLSNCCVVIGAPQGKEDKLVEYIYYSHYPEKTGDSDESHYYEMRYVLPTYIQSVKERHLIKRRLTDDEVKYILNAKNKMFFFIESKPDVRE